MEQVDRLRGVAVGAAVGDALGMPLEFGRAIPQNRFVREMQRGRLPAGSFTDDTEMALALADSLADCFPLDPANLAQHFANWYRARPADVGIQTANVMLRLIDGEGWQAAVAAVQARNPDSAGNGSIMRCWPVVLAYHRDPRALAEASRLQSLVTHPHDDCVAAAAFVNLTTYYLLEGAGRPEAVERAISAAALPGALRAVIGSAPNRTRDQLKNSGWVRHTVESAVWGLLTTDSFEEAIVQVANLGQDADTAASVAGALAGAAYGVSAIPKRWRSVLQGRWPLGDGAVWNEARFVDLADRLAGLSGFVLTAQP